MITYNTYLLATKKDYEKPLILQELDLEVRAGFSQEPDASETGLAPIYLGPGVFTIDSNEP